MRLKSVHISQYKNLKDFTLRFDSTNLIDIFVGKNGAGKSNFFEALIGILRHLYEYDREKEEFKFNYQVSFDIDGKEVLIAWENSQFKINDKKRKTLGKTMLPDNVLIYYSGHNDTVTGLVKKYELAFRKRIKKADFDESRQFIGIGPEYKELLLSVLLIQKNSKAQQFICHKLGIKTVGSEVKLVLKRPLYANSSVFDIEDNVTDCYWKAQGITKTFLDALNKCISLSTGNPVRAEGYFEAEDFYIQYFDIAKIQVEFKDFSPQELFRQFDNLKILNMLAEVSIQLTMENNSVATIDQFSDGQFQSVYIYSIVELFKDRNCITLLDEPDSFLHPEWQFDFLKQLSEITEATAKSNHILMSSHSASTIATISDNMITLFELENNNIVAKKVNKSDIIKSLSSGLISFSESEARLNINHVLKNTTGAILFTEGITDETILETAWSKLYPNERRSFEIQNAFSCGFLRNLMREGALYQKHPGRTFFSIFDFDEAYSDWDQLGNEVQSDPYMCLTKKHSSRESYALLLPVPANDPIRKQVINPHTGSSYKKNSLLTIELLFYGVPELDSYFIVDIQRTDGFIKFINDSHKVKFAEEIVPNIHAKYFEVFRPIFEFIRLKCLVPVTPSIT